MSERKSYCRECERARTTHQKEIISRNFNISRALISGQEFSLVCYSQLLGGPLQCSSDGEARPESGASIQYCSGRYIKIRNDC